MQKNHAKAIRGLSIASVAVSAVLIVCFIAGAVLMGVVGAVAGTELVNANYYDFDYDDFYGYHHGHGYADYYGDYADTQLAAIMVGVLVWIFGIGALLCAVSLVAAIMALRNWDKPQNYGKVFGWSIAGAIVGFFGSGIVLTVLFVLIAVFVNMDKKLYGSGLSYGGAAPAAPVQPMPHAPQQPMPQASQPQSQPAVQSQPVAQPQPIAQPQPAAQPQPQPQSQPVARPQQPEAVSDEAQQQPAPSAEQSAQAAPDTSVASSEAPAASADAASDAELAVPSAEPESLVIEDTTVAVDMSALTADDDATGASEEK